MSFSEWAVHSFFSKDALTSEDSGSDSEAKKGLPKEVGDAWKATLKAYEEEFGQAPPSDIWGSPGKGCVALNHPKSLKPSPTTVGSPSYLPSCFAVTCRILLVFKPESFSVV